jgi:hypothetical protein
MFAHAIRSVTWPLWALKYTFSRRDSSENVAYHEPTAQREN